MRTMTYTESRARYAEVLDAVIENREEIVITRAGHEPAVIMALAEYESLLETMHLFRNPANAQKILNSIEQLESGRGQQHELIDPDAE
jgi:antitoxin YefM